MIALPVHAQDVPAEEAPAPNAPVVPPTGDPDSEPEPEVSEPEPEVSEPEPEVSEPEPEVSDSAGGLGTAAPEAQPSPAEQTRADLADAREEAEEEAELEELEEEGAPTVGEEGDGEGGTLSAAERLASVTGGQGVSWTFPFSWSNNLSVDTLRPKHRPTYNPLYSMSFSVAPRYIFTPVVSIGARMSLDVEFTDSNFTPEARDLEWGDVQVDTTFTLPYRPGGLTIAPAIALRLPTSQVSRGQSRALGPTARLGLIKVFSVAEGLIIGGSLGYTYWINHDGQRRQYDGSAGPDGNTGVDVTGRPINISSQDCNLTRSSPSASNLNTGGCAGGNQVQHQPSIAAFVSLVPVDHLTVSLSFAAFWLVNRGHDTSYLGADDGIITVDGQPAPFEDTSPTHSTTITSFSASVGWDWTPYLTTTLGYSTLAIYPDSDGTFENFIYNENSQFNLSVSFRPSALVTELRSERRNAEQAAAELQHLAF